MFDQSRLYIYVEKKTLYPSGVVTGDFWVQGQSRLSAKIREVYTYRWILTSHVPDFFRICKRTLVFAFFYTQTRNVGIIPKKYDFFIKNSNKLLGESNREKTQINYSIHALWCGRGGWYRFFAHSKILNFAKLTFCSTLKWDKKSSVNNAFMRCILILPREG